MIKCGLEERAHKVVGFVLAKTIAKKLFIEGTDDLKFKA